MTRGADDRLAQAEEAAKQSIIEYLTMNYEVEAELEKGRQIIAYNPQITYPSGAHFLTPDGRIVQTLKTVNGIKRPLPSPCWEEHAGIIDDESSVTQYSQRFSYSPGDMVAFGTRYFKCLDYNGPDFGIVRVPGVNAWERIETEEWGANIDYEPWTVVSYEGDFYALVNEEDNRRLITNPAESGDWGLIGEYEDDYEYELSPHEYVVFQGQVYYPVMNPNADEVKLGVNVKLHDPRNPNLKKHMLRLADYELHKLISPTNVSQSRITDYEASLRWLRDAAGLKLSPGIPRKTACDKKPRTNFATATYMRSYDPYENMWHV